MTICRVLLLGGLCGLVCFEIFDGKRLSGILNLELISQRSTRNGTTKVNDTRDGHYWNKNPCTFGLFRRYYKNYGYFPSGGEWINSTTPKYNSSVCHLEHDIVPSHELNMCFAKSKMSSILTMGASNAQRYYREIYRKMEGFSTECQKPNQEKLKLGGFYPDRDYFTRGRNGEMHDKTLQVHYRHCSGCGARNGKCFWTSQDIGTDTMNKTIIRRQLSRISKISSTQTQHLPITMILDTAVNVMVPFNLYKSNDTSWWASKYYAQTSPEFFFKLYLEGNYPELLLIFLPFNHVVTKDHLRSAPADIAYFHAMMKLYIPPTTKVVYMPAFSEFTEAKRIQFWKNHTVDGLTSLKRIDKLNHILFDVISDDLVNTSSGIYGFFDLVDMSRDRLSWSLDGEHMQPVWYESVMSYFWQTLCNSFRYKDF